MAKKGGNALAQGAKAGPPTKQANSKAGAQAGANDPFALLRYEHRTLDSLFSQFETRKDHDVARRACTHIMLHSKVEEDFYREAEAIPELHGRIDKSLRDHRHLEELTEAICCLNDGEALNEQMLVLQDAVEQHVRDEERSVFPAVLKAMSKHRLRDLALNLRAKKDKLLKNSGDRPASPTMPADEGEAA